LIFIFRLSFLFLFFSYSLGGENVRVATYNVRNYLSMDRLAGGRWKENYPKPEIECSMVRKTIQRVDPDVLALQEMGEERYLIDLWADLNASGIGGYSYSYWTRGTEEEKRHLALLSRIPIKKSRSHLNLEFSYFGEKLNPRRGLMEVDFETNGKNWRLFNLHLKSKWTERKDDPQASSLREKEARAIRDYIRFKYPAESNSLHLVVGDFNDFKNSAPLRRFFTVNKKTLHHVLPCQDTMGYFWTHYYKKQDSYDRLDYMFASPAMLTNFVVGSARIADSFRFFEGSDHRMIYADFEF